MPTTVLVSEETRERLAAARDALGASSMDDAIRKIMRAATPSAKELFQRNRAKVLAVCKSHGLKRLVAFGSRARGDATPGSDLDLITTFPPHTTLVDIVEIQKELTEAFGCKVDIGSEPPASSGLAKQVKEHGVVLLGPSDR